MPTVLGKNSKKITSGSSYRHHILFLEYVTDVTRIDTTGEEQYFPVCSLFLHLPLPLYLSFSQ